jgi:hypothetical protein
MTNTDPIQFKVHGYSKLLKFQELERIPPRFKSGLIRVVDLKSQHNYFMRYEMILRKFR